MPSKPTPSPRGEFQIRGGVLSAVLGAVWYLVLMRPIGLAAAAGPICGHRGLLITHCPPCYAALALVVAGLAAIAAGVRANRRAAAVPAVAKPRR